MYTFDFRGEQILVNHCLIAKLVMGAFVFFAAASIIYIAMFVSPVHKAGSLDISSGLDGGSDGPGLD